MKISSAHVEGSGKDHWNFGGGGSNKWERIHLKWRQTLFTPMKVAKGPTCGDEVGNWRHTVGRLRNGRVFQTSDQWKTLDPALAHARVEEFIGVTVFDNSPECDSRIGQAGDILTVGGCKESRCTFCHSLR